MVKKCLYRLLNTTATAKSLVVITLVADIVVIARCPWVGFGVRNLRRAGICESVIMKTGGWRTRSVFERYAIVSQTDIADALKKLEVS